MSTPPKSLHVEIFIVSSGAQSVLTIISDFTKVGLSEVLYPPITDFGSLRPVRAFLDNNCRKLRYGFLVKGNVK